MWEEIREKLEGFVCFSHTQTFGVSESGMSNVKMVETYGQSEAVKLRHSEREKLAKQYRLQNDGLRQGSEPVFAMDLFGSGEASKLCF